MQEFLAVIGGLVLLYMVLRGLWIFFTELGEGLGDMYRSQSKGSHTHIDDSEDGS